MSSVWEHYWRYANARICLRACICVRSVPAECMNCVWWHQNNPIVATLLLNQTHTYTHTQEAWHDHLILLSPHSPHYNALHSLFALTASSPPHFFFSLNPSLSLSTPSFFFFVLPPPLSLTCHLTIWSHLLLLIRSSFCCCIFSGSEGSKRPFLFYSSHHQ